MEIYSRVQPTEVLPLGDIDFASDAIDMYLKLCDGMQAVAFCHSIDYSKYLTTRFTNAGVSCAYISSQHNKVDREAIFSAFKAGEIKVLFSVSVVDHPYQAPNAAVVMMLRPTNSASLYEKWLSFVDRCWNSAVVLDFVGNVHRHGLPGYVNSVIVEASRV